MNEPTNQRTNVYLQKLLVFAMIICSNSATYKVALGGRLKKPLQAFTQ